MSQEAVTSKQCTALTKAKVQCRNRCKVGELCGVHLKMQKKVEASTVIKQTCRGVCKNNKACKRVLKVDDNSAESDYFCTSHKHQCGEKQHQNSPEGKIKEVPQQEAGEPSVDLIENNYDMEIHNKLWEHHRQIMGEAVVLDEDDSQQAKKQRLVEEIIL